MTFTFSFYITDKDVLQDHEIQGFANEMSAQGLGSNGGKGKVRINSVICYLPFKGNFFSGFEFSLSEERTLTTAEVRTCSRLRALETYKLFKKKSTFL